MDVVYFKYGTPEYKRAHAKVERIRGKASGWPCRHPACPEDAFSWSHIHGTDQFDVSNYVPLCIKHHNRLDAKLQHEDVAKIKEDYATGKWSMNDLAYIYGVTRFAISNVVRGVSWT